LAPLLQFRKPRLNPTARRLADALTIEDLRRIAKRRTPKAVDRVHPADEHRG